jgi:hypothetical protein
MSKIVKGKEKNEDGSQREALVFPKPATRFGPRPAK